MKTCKNGHPVVGENIYRRGKWLYCKICRRAYEKKYRQNKTSGAPKLAYKCGHPKTPDNILLEGTKTRCKTCVHARAKRYRQRQKSDGLEEFYGPVPPHDPELVDWVVLLRVAENGRAPRKLTRGEARVARTLGLYQGEGNDRVKPAWAGVPYGGGGVGSEYQQRSSKGRSHVSRIENEVLFSMRGED